MSMILFLYLVLLISFIIAGYIISSKRLNAINYWIVSSIPILLYALISGLRYGRGADYFHYKRLYENAFNLESYWKSDQIEILFQGINKLLLSLGLPYYIAFLTYSLIIIIPGFIFLKRYPKICIFAVPLYYFFVNIQAENLVRQLFAFGIVLISINYFFTRRILISAFVFIAAYFIHTSVLFYVPVFFIFNKFKNPFHSIYVIILLYCISWLWQTSMIFGYLDIISFIIPKNYLYYIQIDEIWTKMKYTGSTFYLFRLFITNLLILILGHKLLTQKTHTEKEFYVFYYFYVLGAILQHIGFESELIYRVSYMFYLFGFFVVANILHFFIISHRKSYLYLILSAFICVNLIYDSISPIINLDNNSPKFIWELPD